MHQSSSNTIEATLLFMYKCSLMTRSNHIKMCKHPNQPHMLSKLWTSLCDIQDSFSVYDERNFGRPDDFGASYAVFIIFVLLHNQVVHFGKRD